MDLLPAQQRAQPPRSLGAAVGQGLPDGAETEEGCGLDVVEADDRQLPDRGVDGFRVDVAHGLAKNLAEPLAPAAGIKDPIDGTLPPGSHPLWDRDEVHGIYAEWRRVFNEYQPPRAAVAEAWVHPSRRPRYASPDGLGQAFNFDLLEANWSAGEFLRVITDNLTDAQRQGSSSTWVLSNHDLVRHATRYGLPPEDRRGHQGTRDWLLSGVPRRDWIAARACGGPGPRSC